MTAFYFSPTGTSKRVAEEICGAWGKCEMRDLLRTALTEDLTLPAGAPILVAVPVYAGLIPPVAREMLRHLHGTQTPAIAAVVYGNRDYDDALLELTDLLEAQGFCVVAAGAFVAQHSIFPKVAKGRPDQADKAALAEFGARSRQAVERFTPETHLRLAVKGNPEYSKRKPGKIPFQPAGNENCTKCRACVARCPMGAISADNPRVTDGEKCISCGACVYICPVEARGYRGAAYAAAELAFGVKCGARREAETFF